jgi:hypothetical protein
MSTNISQSELSLLAYFHENANGFGKEFGVSPDKIRQALGTSEDDFVKDVSYLEEHKLVGSLHLNLSTMNRAAFYKLGSVWLTGLGENYMRELERAQGVGKRITVKVVKEMGSALERIAIGVLTAVASAPFKTP